MIVEEFIHLLSLAPQNYEIYVLTPDEDDDFFVDNVKWDHGKEQVFIETAQ